MSILKSTPRIPVNHRAAAADVASVDQHARIAGAQARAETTALMSDHRIVPLADDEHIARLTTALAALTAAKSDRERLIEIAALEEHLRPTGDGITTASLRPASTVTRTRLDPADRDSPVITTTIVTERRDDQLRARLALLRAQDAPAPAAEDSAVTRALALASGERVYRQPESVADRRARLLAEIAELDRAIREIRQQIDARRDELSYEIAKQQQAKRFADLREYFELLDQLTRSVSAIHAHSNAITAAGYQQRPDLLPSIGVRGVLTAGAVTQRDSPVWHERERLVNLGVLK